MSEPTPTVSPLPEREYLQHLAEGRFMIQRSRASGRFVFYPRVAEPATGATDLEWVEASGGGTVYATSTMRQNGWRSAQRSRQRAIRLMNGLTLHDRRDRTRPG